MTLPTCRWFMQSGLKIISVFCINDAKPYQRPSAREARSCVPPGEERIAVVVGIDFWVRLVGRGRRTAPRFSAIRLLGGVRRRRPTADRIVPANIDSLALAA